MFFHFHRGFPEEAVPNEEKQEDFHDPDNPERKFGISVDGFNVIDDPSLLLSKDVSEFSAQDVELGNLFVWLMGQWIPFKNHPVWSSGL